MKRENEKLQAQSIVLLLQNLKFTGGIISLLLGYDENCEIILLKPNIIGKRFVASLKKKYALPFFVCGRNGHLNYGCPYKSTKKKKKSINEMGSQE